MSNRGKAHRPEQEKPQGDQLRAAALFVALFFAAGVLLFLGVFGGLRIYSVLTDEAGPPRVAIVDQLSLTAPNPAFAGEATQMLEAAGYAVDYYPGEQVTVDFYRDLAKRDYELVLLRAHAGRHQVDGKLPDDTRLFTSEPYSPTKYVEEQRDGRLSISLFDRGQSEESELYFGIPAEFVTSSMKGNFDGATVVLMGCDVLRGERLAQAFVEKGAVAVVGWDGPVSASHTDAATLNLLERMLDDELAAPDAAAAAMAELGPDPFYDSVLLSYSPEG